MDFFVVIVKGFSFIDFCFIFFFKYRGYYELLEFCSFNKKEEEFMLICEYFEISSLGFFNFVVFFS